METKYFRNCVGVFQGGGSRALAIVGAIEVARQRGVNFSAVAGTSAGSIVAALLAAGLSDAEMVEAVSGLRAEHLLTRLRRSSVPWIYRPGFAHENVQYYLRLKYDAGLYTVEGLRNWLTDTFRKYLGNDNPRFSDLYLATRIAVTDLQDRKLIAYGDNPYDHVIDAIVKSCAIPFFFLPISQRYSDGGILANLPVHLVPESSALTELSSRVLAFELNSDSTNEPVGNLMTLANAVAGSVVDGSRQLHKELISPRPAISIHTGSMQATDFEELEKEEIRNRLLASGREAATRFFDGEQRYIVARTLPLATVADRDELYCSYITALESNPTSYAIFLTNDTRFVWDLFPTLLKCLRTGVQIHVRCTKKEGGTLAERYRANLLDQMCDVQHDHVPTPAWLLCDAQANIHTAFLFQGDALEGPSPLASQYRKVCDPVLLEILGKQLLTGSLQNRNIIAEPLGINVRNLTDRLRSISYYSRPSTSMSLETVELSRLRVFARHIREYKLAQLPAFDEVFENAGSELYSPLAIKLRNGKPTMICPPVGELVGDDVLLVQGSARAFLARLRGKQSVQVIVVKDAVGELPSDTHFALRNCTLVSRQTRIHQQIPGLRSAAFRKVEEAVHLVEDVS